MEAELTGLVVQVFGILVLVGALGGLIRLGYNYLQQATGQDDEALVDGLRKVGAATLWIILAPTVLWILVQFALLIRFDVGIRQVVDALGRVVGS